MDCGRNARGSKHKVRPSEVFHVVVGVVIVILSEGRIDEAYIKHRIIVYDTMDTVKQGQVINYHLKASFSNITTDRQSEWATE